VLARITPGFVTDHAAFNAASAAAAVAAAAAAAAAPRVLMPSELYAPGTVPPPHLSPFVDNEAEGYTPEFAHTIKQLQVRVISAYFC
jgi:hypothetical protein